MLDLARYLAWRLVGAALTIIAGAAIVFVIMKASPGDPALFVLGDFATPEAVARFRIQHGLDAPVLAQLWTWLAGLFSASFGNSLSLYPDYSISGLILDRLPNTVFVGGLALLLSILVSLVLGSIAAIRRGHLVDTAITSVAVVGVSMPDFWFGYILILAFSLSFNLFPAYGFVNPFDSLWEALVTGFLPAFAIAAPISGAFTRVLRVSLLETLNRDYVRTARSFGIHPLSVFVHFVMRNALIPYVTVIGLQVRFLLGGVVVVEKIFGVPGIGSLMVDAIFARDFQLVQACAVAFLMAVISTNLAVDLVCTLLDPRRAR